MSTALFLEKLESLGGNASTRALREALGWDKELFKSIEDSLLAAGAVAKDARSIR